MISFKNDFRDFENNLFKYLLLTKNEDKLDNKKLRSLSFKNFKNPHLAEKMSKTLIKNKFNYFDLNETKLTIDFSSLTVQFIDD
jgi:NurA-like 5'-3' nuclease